jgi:hypothetical protein
VQPSTRQIDGADAIRIQSKESEWPIRGIVTGSFATIGIEGKTRSCAIDPEYTS